MIASGFIEANGLQDVDRVVDELRRRGVEVNETSGEKIVFLVERSSEGEVKSEIESLKEIDGVRNVYLAYYSIDGGDKEPDNFTVS